MSKTVDSAVLGDLKELLADGFAVLVDRFATDGQIRIDKIQAALVIADDQTVYAEAHGLKGSSRNVGAEKLGDYCGRLEEMGRLQELTGAEAIFTAMATEFAAVNAALTEFAQR